ncbi:hypothetical protein [Piscibacillus salipiscarius]|uniref:Phage protein n=1 Tax=Piscibacillus salipiscarius TaxID=299480 RepID=A0ABW5Q7H6_9BACI|nr:hypothetical protein [Piscibacillus salipiscarius]
MEYQFYEAFKVDPIIQEKVGQRIKFYKYPNTEDLEKGPFIIIDPLDPPLPSDYADNKWLTEDYLYQIEVWSFNKTDRDLVAKQIQQILWDQFNFGNYGGGVDEWDQDLNVYRDARRYRGKKYVN